MYMMNPWRCKIDSLCGDYKSWTVNLIISTANTILPILLYQFFEVLVNFNYSCRTQHISVAILWRLPKCLTQRHRASLKDCLLMVSYLQRKSLERCGTCGWGGFMDGWVGFDHLNGLGVARCTEGFARTFRSSWLDLSLHVDIALDHESQIFEPLTMWV